MAEPSASQEEPIFTMEEVSRHCTETDNWIVVDSVVYDVTKFAKMHPGGKAFLVNVAGRDATSEFFEFHRGEILTSGMGARLRIGRVAEKKETYTVKPGDLSTVPFAEGSAWMGWRSPYFGESHMRFRAALRKFMDENIAPDAAKMDEAGMDPSQELYRKMGAFGLLASRIGPGPHLEMLEAAGIKFPGGVKAKEFDFFHELIAHEEISRLGTPGFCDGLGAGMVIGLPPVLHFAPRALAAKVLKEVLLGEKRICLAISEPAAGSDVANIRCTATLSADGSHYIVNGVKKWITNGTFSDYFVTAVRTGGPGMGGISLLLIERGEGLETKKIKTSYSPAAGTAYVIYEDVKVPVANVLGKVNRGFQCIMANFNHERWMIVTGVNRGSRLVLEECYKWANQRQVFNKSLTTQPVIRQKLAHMSAQVEAVQAWIELITHQMCNMSYAEQNQKLAGPIALLKVHSTRVAHFVSDEACQIFGGRAITRTGMGQVVERFQKSVKFGAILGGSEEIMADLGVRQALKSFPQARL